MMGTSCALGYKKSDGTIQKTRVNWDAYPHGVGKDLIYFWSSDEKASQICNCPEIRTLDKTEVEIYVDSKPSSTYSNMQQFKNICGNEDYGYLYMDGKWNILDKKNNIWINLKSFLIKNNKI